MTAESTESAARNSWRLRFEERRDYLYAEVSGPQDSLDITLAYWRAIEAECGTRGARTLLVCDRLFGEPATPEDFRRLVEALHDSDLRALRIAFFEPVSDHLREVEHGELAFRDAGFTLRVFGNEREAELWLRYGQP